MMIAYHDKKSLDELFMKNYRIYSISENFCLDFTNLSNTNGLGLLQIPLINQKNVNLLKFFI